MRIGSIVDQHKGVPVFENGRVQALSHGRNYAPCGYYLGQKWQCVEFVKRYYFSIYKHQMPHVWGHAFDYFDASLAQGELNSRRALRQYRNYSSALPQAGDIIICRDSKYGHVAIITQMMADGFQVIQQNVYAKTRENYALSNRDGVVVIEGSRKVEGWLSRQ